MTNEPSEAQLWARRRWHVLGELTRARGLLENVSAQLQEILPRNLAESAGEDALEAEMWIENVLDVVKSIRTYKEKGIIYKRDVFREWREECPLM